MHWPLIGSQQPVQFAEEHVGGGEPVQRWFEQNGVVPAQAEQKLPLEPHAEALVPDTQVPVPMSMQPEQGRQAPLWQVCIEGQAVHAAAFAPHCAEVGAL